VRNFLRTVVVSVLAVFLLSGCAEEYRSNMQARKEIAWAESTNQRLATSEVMGVISKILNPIEKESKKQSEEKSIIKLETRGVKSSVSSDSAYALGLMAQVMGKMVAWQGRAEIMRARAEAIRYLTPIIEAIYSQHMQDFGTPMSTNQLLSKLFDQIPFVATVGGMYGLGVSGIQNAGDSIAATLSGDGNTFNYKGSQTVAKDGGIIGGENEQRFEQDKSDNSDHSDNSDNSTSEKSTSEE